MGTRWRGRLLLINGSKLPQMSMFCAESPLKRAVGPPTVSPTVSSTLPRITFETGRRASRRGPPQNVLGTSSGPPSGPGSALKRAGRDPQGPPPELLKSPEYFKGAGGHGPGGAGPAAQRRWASLWKIFSKNRHLRKWLPDELRTSRDTGWTLSTL